MANNLVFTGVVGFISTVETGTDKKGNEYRKGYFVVGEPDAKIPNELKIEWYNHKSPELLQVGDEVEVSYNLRVKEYNDKHYLSANLWKLNNLSNPQQVIETQNQASGNKYASLKAPVSVPMGEPMPEAEAAPATDDSGLPF